MQFTKSTSSVLSCDILSLHNAKGSRIEFVFLFLRCLYLSHVFVLLKKDPQPSQQQHQHVPIMSEDEAAGLRKPLIRFHCISCDRPIDVQPHPFVSFVIIEFIVLVFRFRTNFFLFLRVDNNRVFPQIWVCVPSSHPDHTLLTNWTKFANFKRGLLLFFLR